MMRFAFGAWCGRPGRAPKPAAAPGDAAARGLGREVLPEEGGQGRGPDAGARELEEAPPTQKLFEMRVHGHSFVIVPSKFRMRLATIVYDASSATSNVSSRPDSPWLTSSRAAPRSAW